MRWKGLIGFVILLAVGLGISSLYLDGWLESGLEKAGEAAVGARVEIDGFDFRLLDLSAGWDRLQAADKSNPLRNIFETGRAELDLQSAALLRKRFIIDEATLAEVRTGSPRETDGSLPRPVQSDPAKPGLLDKAKATLTREVEKLPVMQFDARSLRGVLDVDSLVASADLKFSSHMDSTRSDILGTTATWQAFYTNFQPTTELAGIRSELEGLDPKSIDTLPEVISTLETLKRTRTRLESVSDSLTTIRGRAGSDLERMTSYRRQTGVWLEEDYRTALRAARLPDLSAKSVGESLFGAMLAERIERVLDVARIIRRIIPEKTTKPEKGPRLEGQTVQFDDQHGWPTFLVRRLHLSGQTGATDQRPGTLLQGEALDITSQPWITRKPAIINLSGVSDDGRSLRFDAWLDHITTATSDSFTIAYSGLPLRDLTLSESAAAPITIRSGTADATMSLVTKPDRIDIVLDVQARGLDFAMGASDAGNPLGTILRDVLKRMDLVTLQAHISGSGDDLDFSLRSNVDEQIAVELKALASRSLEETKQRIRTRIRTAADDQINALNRVLDENGMTVTGPISGYVADCDDLKRLAQDKIKALTDEVEKRQKDQLEQKARGLLDRLK